jgi:S-methylmethionine-dependent homocysteine/selenocysteine methylase/SAM-dependent methyltransferase
MTVRDLPGYGPIRASIQNQRCVILDGGVATELPHEHGQDHEHLWGIEALASAPEEVLAVHRGYVDAGVDVLTTNTWALPTALLEDGDIGRDRHRPVHWTEIARRGVSVARTAIADAGRDGEVAVAFSLNADLDSTDGAESAALIARTLEASPPDLILLETLSLVRASLFDVVRALLETSIPVWLSFRRCRHGLCGVYGQHWGGPEGDAFGRAAHRFEELGVSALLVNCIPPDHVDGIVASLRDFTDLPLGVYPNLGYYTSKGWRTESDIGGSEYAEMALRWRAEGAQIIGGCCGTRPEHIAAAREALVDTRPGRERRDELPVGNEEQLSTNRSDPAWTDNRGRKLHPVGFPLLTKEAGVTATIPGSYLMWRHLFEERAGAHQRCLDIGCGVGLQTVQLALNGASHVHAIDLDERAVSNALDNAFRNGVADRVSGAVADIYPWLPSERYELVVANLPQVPIDPLAELSSHRPTDYWGRGLIDQVISKLPRALASEGYALITLTSLLSRERTIELLDRLGLAAKVVAWELEDLPSSYSAQGEHLTNILELSDAYLAHVGEMPVLANYLLEIRHAASRQADTGSPWQNHS